MSTPVMQSDLRTMMHDVAPAALAVTMAIGGFGLLRVAAIVESYLLLFLSFAFMLGGILLLFGNGSHHRPYQRIPLRQSLRSLWKAGPPTEDKP